MLSLLAITTAFWGTSFAAAPSFDENFANFLTDDAPDEYGRVETVFSLCVDRKLTLMDNIKNLFYPTTLANPDAPEGCKQNPGGQLRILIRNLSFVLMFVFIIMAGVNLIMKAKDPEGPKKSFSSLLYIAYGAFLIFGVIWILGTVLNLPNIQGTTQLANKLQNNLFLQILSFFKVLGFFLAIVMMVISGVKIMAAMDKDDKLKTARKGVLNVILALVFIKIIDYIYYIAQAPTFATKAADLIVNVAVIAGYVLGAIFVGAMFYAGFMLITSIGSEEGMKKAKSAIINIVIVAAVVFLFLLIVYQIFNEFA